MIWKNKIKLSIIAASFFLVIPFVVGAAGSDNVGIFQAYPDEKVHFSSG